MATHATRETRASNPDKEPVYSIEGLTAIEVIEIVLTLEREADHFARVARSSGVPDEAREIAHRHGIAMTAIAKKARAAMDQIATGRAGHG